MSQSWCEPITQCCRLLRLLLKFSLTSLFAIHGSWLTKVASISGSSEQVPVDALAISRVCGGAGNERLRILNREALVADDVDPIMPS